PFTEVIPKPLLPIGEKAILQIQIEHLKSYGFDDIVLATNYKSEYIAQFFGDGSKLGVRLRISKEEEALGTAGPLSLLKDELTEPFLVMNGDILSAVDLGRMYRFALLQDSVLTIAIKKEIFPFRFGNISFDGDRVTCIEEKPDFITWILAGIYVMKPSILERIPHGQAFGMDQLIQGMLADGIPVSKYELSEYWLDIGKVDDFEKAQEDYILHFNG
ncbi:MAG: mannose-1-phosphate guanyltransferase, partial [Bacteroidales bacterium]|nr:mannose-1-phosphate guanyltransferase [Bacteroidales bacterium]